MSDMITTKTEIDGLLSKIDSCHKKMGGLIAEFIITKTQSGKHQNIETDLKNLVNELPEQDRNDVLIYALASLARAGLPTGSICNSESMNTKKKKTNDIFANRGLY